MPPRARTRACCRPYSLFAQVPPSFALSVLHWAGNVALGILAAVVWKTQSGALPLLAIPLAFNYFVYRGWIRSVQQRACNRSGVCT